ncbi:MAG: hypothetical protein ACQEXV_18035 [Bacillota bacterium]
MSSIFNRKARLSLLLVAVIALVIQGSIGGTGIIIDVAVSHFTLDRVEIRDTTIGALLRRTRDSEITNSRLTGIMDMLLLPDTKAFQQVNSAT